MDWKILASINIDDQRRLLASAHRRRFRRGDIIFYEGDPAEALHLLAVGHVTVSITIPNGESAIVSILGPGAVFGELALVSRNETRAATIRALEHSESLSLSRSQFEMLREASPTIDQFLIEVLATRLRTVDSYLMEALFIPAHKRVLRRLLAVGRLYQSNSTGVIRVPISQDILASMAGTSRPTANQVLRAAITDGIIQVRRSMITILQPDELAKRAI